VSSSELATRISKRLGQDILNGSIARGAHIGTQQVADRYQVSRTPVREALETLENTGILERIPNRGYFVAENISSSTIREVEAQAVDDHEHYQRFAEDWLTNQLPENVTELHLRKRYSVTKSKINEMLARAAREGWAERKEGYGWRFLPVAKTAEAFDEIYRFRMAIEPAALLEPKFEINRKALQEHRQIQERMLETEIWTAQAERLIANGAQFHEDLIKMSHNPFFFSALERVNKMRRLMEYRTHVNHESFTVQCTEHLQLIDLLERGEIVEASYFMRRHLSGALKRKSPVAWNWAADTHSKKSAKLNRTTYKNQ